MALVARTRSSFGSGGFDSTYVFARRAWFVFVARRKLTLDTRFVPATDGIPPPRLVLVLVLEGQWQFLSGATSTGRLDGPVALILTEAQIEGRDGARSCNFRQSGERFIALELRLPSECFAVDARVAPSPIEVGPAVFHAARAAVSVVDDDDAVEARIGELLQHLVGGGILTQSGVDVARPQISRSMQRVLNLLQSLFTRLWLGASVKELGAVAAITPKQIDRDFRAFFSSIGLARSGWRSLSRHLRFRVAVLMLSAEGVSVTDVAKAVGYGSTRAMARAFEDAGLPPPRVVQAALRGEAEPPVSASGA